jgi:hypothetical protein
MGNRNRLGNAVLATHKSPYNGKYRFKLSKVMKGSLVRAQTVLDTLILMTKRVERWQKAVKIKLMVRCPVLESFQQYFPDFIPIFTIYYNDYNILIRP